MSKLFEQIDQVWGTDPELTTKTVPESPYMTIRFLSLTEAGFFAACDANRMIGLPPSAVLPFLKYSTPTRRAPRSKYPKKTIEGKKLNPKEKKALDIVMRTFNVTEFHGKQIMGLLIQSGVSLGVN